MRITQDNYEQYFLDHAEGNLSPEMERELADFLDANPDLKPILDEYDPSPLQTRELRNELLKSRLRRGVRPTEHIREEDIDDWMIREVEGLLNESEANELNEFLALNPAYVYDQEKFRQTKLIPDLSVTFSNKVRLKKKAPVLPIVRLAWLIPSAAAVVLIYLGIRFLQQPVEVETNPLRQIVAEQETPSQIEETPSQFIGTPSPGTPSHGMESPVVLRPASFRLNPTVAKAVTSTENKDITPDIHLLAYTLPSPLIPEQKEKSLLARAFKGMLAQARDGIKEQVDMKKLRKTDFSFWSLAKAGVEGFNSMSDRDLELFVRKDEDGKVRSYALVEEDRLLLSKELNKD